MDPANEKVVKFMKEFDFSEMDTKIHRFPAGLRGINYPYIVPRLVSIGPYHHGLKHLEMMEEVKEAALHFLSKRTGLPMTEEMYKEFNKKLVEDDARAKYIMEGINDFAAMMLRDACFLLVYMDSYSRSYGNTEDHVVHMTLRRFLFSNRDSIENDMMLLENQLPWAVVQALVDLIPPANQGAFKYKEVVGKFIAGMGNAFKVREAPPEEVVQPWKWDDGWQPPHLLALLRRHKTESGAPLQVQGNRCLPHLLPLLQPHRVTGLSAITPMELEEIGIKLAASRTPAFSDMSFEEGHLLGKLSLAPLSLSEARASCLVNMAAFEVCTAKRFGDDPDNTAVCSYLGLLAMFMVQKDDVQKLRSRGLLHGPQSNAELLTFFKSVVKHLPDRGSRFAHITYNVGDYKNKSLRTVVYKWLYNNLMTVIKVLSIIATVIGVYKAVLSVTKKTQLLSLTEPW